MDDDFALRLNIVEFVVIENNDLNAKLFRAFERVMGGDAIVASEND